MPGSPADSPPGGPTSRGRGVDPGNPDGYSVETQEYTSAPDSSAVPKNFLNMVRIPLSSFADAGLAVTNVTSVEFDFDQRPSGSYLIADLAFEI
jgi:hypothetical protein